MTTTALDRIPVEQISERAREFRFGRFVAAVCLAPFLLAGWVAAKTVPLAWHGVLCCYAATEKGWLSANAPSARAENAMLRQQVDELQKAVERLGGP